MEAPHQKSPPLITIIFSFWIFLRQQKWAPEDGAVTPKILVAAASYAANFF